MVRAASSSPSTPSAALARAERACPDHGVLHDALGAECPRCGKNLYDLALDDDRAIMRSLRKVLQSQRLTRARFVTFPIALIMLAGLLGLGALTYLLLFPVGEGLARALEPVLRAGQKAPLRELDRRVL